MNNHKLQEIVEFSNGLELRVMTSSNGELADFWEVTYESARLFFKSLSEVENFVSSIPAEDNVGSKYHLLSAYTRNWTHG